MRQALVTVIIPTFNSSRYLEECLKSVCDQTYRNLEIIIIDDGSSDGTQDICRNFANSDSRIKLILQDHRGVSAARNNGIKSASGQYITFLDSDDYLCETAIDTLVNCLKKNNSDLSAGGYMHLYKNRKKRVSKSEERIFDAKDLLQDSSIGGFVCNKLYKTSIVRNNTIFFPEDIPIIEDVIFNLQYLQHCRKAIHTTQITYYYRIRESSVTNSGDLSSLRASFLKIEQDKLASGNWYQIYKVQLLAKNRFTRSISPKVFWSIMSSSDVTVKTKIKTFIIVKISIIYKTYMFCKNKRNALYE